MRHSLMKLNMLWVGLYYFSLLSKKRSGQGVCERTEGKRNGAPRLWMAHRSSPFSGPDTTNPQSTMPPPLWKDNHLAVVGGELPRGNQIWLDGKNACWDNGPCMLWGTLALSLGDKGVQCLLTHCP